MRIRTWLLSTLFCGHLWFVHVETFHINPSLFSTTEFLQRMSAFPLQYSPLAPLTKKSTKAYESYVVTHTPNRSRAIYPKM